MTAHLPGARALRVLSRLCDPDTLDRLAAPTLADLQFEMREAEAAGASRRAWICLRGHVAILRALLLYSFMSRGAMDMSNERSKVALTTLASVAIFTAIITVQPLMDVEQTVGGNFWLFARLALTLLPQAFGVAIPLGVLFGIALGAPRSTGARSRPSAIAALGVGVVAAVATFWMVGWVVPQGNQSFREQVWRAAAARNGEAGAVVGPSKGVREMTFAELDAALSQARAGDPDSALVHNLRVQRVRAVSLSAACVVLTLAGLGVARRARRRRVVRGALATVAAVGYYALAVWSDRWSRRAGLAPEATAWLPNLVFLALALVTLALPVRQATPPLGSDKSAD